MPDSNAQIIIVYNCVHSYWGKSWLTFLPSYPLQWAHFYPYLHIYFNIPMYKYGFLKFSFELVIPHQFLINELNKIFNVYSL